MKYTIEYQNNVGIWRESEATGYPKGGFHSRAGAFAETCKLRENMPFNIYRIVLVPSNNREVIATFAKGEEDRNG